MPDNHNFQHLPLILRYKGPARLHGGGSDAEVTAQNKQSRPLHSSSLRQSTGALTSSWQARQVQRTQDHLPSLPQGIPILLEVDPSLDIDKLRHFFDFEIVSEEEEGFVIVASEDINLTTFLTLVTKFASAKPHGSSIVASVHKLYDDPNQTERLRRILSETLFQRWANLVDDTDYLVDIGITCLGVREIPNTQSGKRDSDSDWAQKQRDWAAALLKPIRHGMT